MKKKYTEFELKKALSQALNEASYQIKVGKSKAMFGSIA